MKLKRNFCKSWKWDSALRMRRKMTPAENAFWDLVRLRAFGVNFHRQKLVAGYICDFWCPEKRLIVEVDGSAHKGRQDYDQDRDMHLRTAIPGARIVRFTNEQVLRMPNRVKERLQLLLED